MPTAFMVGGPADGEFAVTDDLETGVIVTKDDRQYVYEVREIWAGDDDFRGFKFVCEEEEGENIQERPGYIVRET